MMVEDPVARAKADLMYAILAVDSYNRGYGTGIKGLSDAAGTKLGNYSVYDSKGDAQALSAGFYAGDHSQERGKLGFPADAVHHRAAIGWRAGAA